MSSFTNTNVTKMVIEMREEVEGKMRDRKEKRDLLDDVELLERQRMLRIIDLSQNIYK